MPGTVIGRTGSLFLFGIGIVWLLIWLILAYSSKQKSTLAVLAVFSLIWAGLGFWRAMVGDVVSMVMLFVILFITLPGMLKVVNQYQRAVTVWKASVSARTWVKCHTALGN